MSSFSSRPYTGNYRFIVISTPKVVKRIGAYASKKVLSTDPNNYTSELQIGKVDLLPLKDMYFIFYTLTFVVSPEFIINYANETFTFKLVWDDASGTYEVREEKKETGRKNIIITYV
ncbi:MAG: hypothetical protein ACFFD2_27520 [Promethearchaeota archaeon]